MVCSTPLQSAQLAALCDWAMSVYVLQIHNVEISDCVVGAVESAGCRAVWVLYVCCMSAVCVVKGCFGFITMLRVLLSACIVAIRTDGHLYAVQHAFHTLVYGKGLWLIHTQVCGFLALCTGCLQSGAEPAAVHPPYVNAAQFVGQLDTITQRQAQQKGPRAYNPAAQGQMHMSCPCPSSLAVPTVVLH